MSDLKHKNPIQPLLPEDGGGLRFKSNKIVEHVYDFAEKNGLELNKIAMMDFSDDDRQQFAQLLGYSFGGYGNLNCVDGDAYSAAQNIANGQEQSVARINALEHELAALRAALREPMARLFDINPNDLKGASYD